MHSDMIALVALDFVLRVVGIGVMDVALVIDVLSVHAHDATADTAGVAQQLAGSRGIMRPEEAGNPSL